MQKKILVVFVLVLSTVVLPACSLTKKSSDSVLLENTPAATESAQPAMDSFVFTAAETDSNALEATKDRATVAVKEYDFGSMVESINGQAASSTHYWALYINDEYAQQAADLTEIKPGDTVRWMYEKLQTGM